MSSRPERHPRYTPWGYLELFFPADPPARCFFHQIGQPGVPRYL